MLQRVLDVGQCDMDHGMICRLIQDHFDAEVIRAHSAAEALTALRAGSFELVLTNRLLDRDQNEGLDLIHQIKSDAGLSSVPVMLVTNFPEHEQQAVAAGAEPGFGKLALDSDQTLQRLSRVLAAK